MSWTISSCHRRIGGWSHNVVHCTSEGNSHKTAQNATIEEQQIRKRKSDNIAAWEPYTDHDLVEITLAIDKLGTPTRNETRPETPKYVSLHGTTAEAESARNRLEESMEAALEDQGGDEPYTWKRIRKVSNEVALQTLGKNNRNLAKDLG